MDIVPKVISLRVISTLEQNTSIFSERFSLFLVMLLACGLARPSCIPGGTETEINAALSVKEANVRLCRNSVFLVSRPIVLSANSQDLATEGEGNPDTFAIIKSIGTNQSTAIFSRASNIHLHHLKVDGQRPRLGYLERGEALIELGGNATGIHVDHIVAYDPRGWSTLDVFEGAKLCTGARVTNNVIGPAGTPDGHWADGISFACREGLIANNRVTDVTDGGIVIFGAPGTLVENNTIETKKTVLLGGINLVDFLPFNGDYQRVLVRHNRIIAMRGYIAVGIAAGPAAWGIGSERDINFGGRIEQNTLIGPNLGYGIVLDGVRNFDVTGNKLPASIIGGSTKRCDARHAPPGLPLLYDATHSSGIFQKGFTNGPARWSICLIDPSNSQSRIHPNAN